LDNFHFEKENILIESKKMEETINNENEIQIKCNCKHLIEIKEAFLNKELKDNYMNKKIILCKKNVNFVL
jgi:hypothetical protein